jgi:hypothetical protein
VARDAESPRSEVATEEDLSQGPPYAQAWLLTQFLVGVSDRQKSQVVTLRRKPLKLDPHIVPDPKYRIKRPDGSLSDMANLTRCRDGLRSFDEAADTFST